MAKKSIGIILASAMLISVISQTGISASAAEINPSSANPLSPVGAQMDPEIMPVGNDASLSEQAENELIEKAAELPKKIDLRDYNGKNYVTRAKIQYPFGTCWAFSAAAASEISYLYENDLGVPAGEENKNVDFSEKYISWYVYHGITENDVTPGKIRASQVGEGYDASESEIKDKNAVYNFGGRNFSVMSLFAAGFSPVEENVMVNGEYPYLYSGKNQIRSGYGSTYSYNDDWTLPLTSEYRNTSSQVYLRNSLILPSPSTRDEDGKYEFSEAGLAAVKSEIANGHGVSVAICVSDRFNEENWTDYNFSTTTANHAVTIVGYDDNYPKENFTRYNKKGMPISYSIPPKDGAFIVKNSCGSITDEDRATAKTDENGKPVYENPNANPWGINDDGCFYLSYYDRTIEAPMSFSFDKADSVKYSKQNYDQYDLMTTGIYANNDYDSETKIANVFDAEEDEYLSQISYVSAVSGASVRYEIYKDIDEGNPTSGTLLEEGDNTHLFSGSYKLDLKGEYLLRKGEKYSVVLTMKYTPKDKDAAVYTDAIPAGASRTSLAKCNGIINAGESFMYTDGKWSDMTEKKESLIDDIYEDCKEDLSAVTSEGKEILTIDNYPIKAILIPA
ncbi:MAG: hypothetical protein IIZ36_01275, partial [Ruminococcus sp.]|nr:hypothetical protein [Ruminococcus sp.]